MADEVLHALAKALGPYLNGEKAAGTPFVGPYMYEGGGLFGRADGPSTIVNAMVGPIGFERYLQWRGTDTEKEFVDALTDIVSNATTATRVGGQERTGYTTYTTNEQSAVCGDCISGALRACAQFYCFGRFCRQSQELQFDRLSLRQHSGIPIKNLFGSITAADGTVIVPMGSELTNEFYTSTSVAGFLLRYRNAQMLWNGNPANNGVAYHEYMGFQMIVNTGKFDAYTQQYCDALDSFLMNANYNPLTSDGTYAVRTWFGRMVREFETRANRAGLDWGTSTMYIVMTPNQWDCIARVYACSGVDLCSLSSSHNNVTVDASQNQGRYEQYLNTKMLPIDGRLYPVVLDSQIPEIHGQANGSCSDIYFITTELNGRTVTYGQYQDFQKTYGSVRNEMVSMFGSDDIAITDNGRFALVRSNVRGCFDVQIYVKPRVVAEMPQLLGRIRNVCCKPQERPFPDVTGSGSIYEPDGGRQSTPPPQIYGDCLDC